MIEKSELSCQPNQVKFHTTDLSSHSRFKTPGVLEEAFNMDDQDASGSDDGDGYSDSDVGDVVEGDARAQGHTSVHDHEMDAEDARSSDESDGQENDNRSGESEDFDRQEQNEENRMTQAEVQSYRSRYNIPSSSESDGGHEEDEDQDYGEDQEEEEQDDESEEPDDSEDEDFTLSGRRASQRLKPKAKPVALGAKGRGRMLDESEEEDDESDEESDESYGRKRRKPKPTPKKKSRRKQPPARRESPNHEGPVRSTRTRDGHIMRKRYNDDEELDDLLSDESDEEPAARPAPKATAPKKRALAKVVQVVEEEEHDDEPEKVLSHRQIEGAEVDPFDIWGSREFLIKWKRYSYLHNSWDHRGTLEQLPGYKRVQNYITKTEREDAMLAMMSPEEQEMAMCQNEMEAAIWDEYKKVDRIVGEKNGPNGVQYLVKWVGLPYRENTWEDAADDLFISLPTAQPEIDAFVLREQRGLDQGKHVDAVRKNFKGAALREQPSYFPMGKLRDYQLDGLNWLIYSWAHNNNCILADEMGLGKTVQCVCFLTYLAQTLKIEGPFMVVVPLSTIPNWAKEFKKWAPQLNCLTYIGDGESRSQCRDYEWYTGRSTGRRYKFHVILTTYELVLKDAGVFRTVKWAYTMVDEAHRLKNNESQLYKEMQTFNSRNRLLVTGTPLQNSIKELWALLHFLEPEKFPDSEEFGERYALKEAEEISALHAELRPHMLRRVIKDVEKSLPPKSERVLRVAMSPLQRQYYKWILKRNVSELNHGVKGTGHVSLLNIVVELKKCCNHPFLFESADRILIWIDIGKTSKKLTA
ncbi:hypothetical protein CYMTET_27107 [Cymbomonas tetramitiformis]|uniref:Uncharacterized protein n=1 Tax=Cymbomonas tetramitiformis TaxID=36881 RepID=A0AAE0FQE9_9CHLO|nr:hypothetical protein CYMTET_27107 [Cymbomonas tetramitiformis]